MSKKGYNRLKPTMCKKKAYSYCDHFLGCLKFLGSCFLLVSGKYGFSCLQGGKKCHFLNTEHKGGTQRVTE